MHASAMQLWTISQPQKQQQLLLLPLLLSAVVSGRSAEQHVTRTFRQSNRNHLKLLIYNSRRLLIYNSRSSSTLQRMQRMPLMQQQQQQQQQLDSVPAVDLQPGGSSGRGSRVPPPAAAASGVCQKP
jgi:hypothetical protein